MAGSLFQVALVAAVCATAAFADTCDSPDTGSATCTCKGVSYDFSQIKPTDDNPYFSAPDQDSEYMYYFQMTNGGLPSDQGAMPYCTFSSGKEQGNAVGQGQIEGDACFPIGEVAQQSWEIDDSVSPQTITVTFAGGEEGRQTVLVATCDPSADNPTFQVKGEIRTLVYELDVTTKYACNGGGPPSPNPPPPSPSPNPPSPSPNPPSPSPNPPGKQTAKKSETGDILTAIFFVSVILYLAAGVAYQFKVKQATGSDLIPNREMWTGLWRLAKDGITFTVAKIRRKDPTYATL